MPSNPAIRINIKLNHFKRLPSREFQRAGPNHCRKGIVSGFPENLSGFPEKRANFPKKFPFPGNNNLSLPPGKKAGKNLPSLLSGATMIIERNA
jgi:hypothetical protein